MSRLDSAGYDPWDDDMPLVGGIHPSPALTYLQADGVHRTHDDIADEIERILSLNSDVLTQFRLRDLAAMDDATKLLLLADIRELLGITPKLR